MRWSAKAEYACVALVSLASRHPAGPPARTREIADAHEIPEGFLVQILHQLKAAGLVQSVRGAGGGFRLARDAAEIDVAMVLDAIDGPEEPPRPADDPITSMLHAVWRDAAAAERRVLSETSIASLVAETQPREWVI